MHPCTDALSTGIILFFFTNISEEAHSKQTGMNMVINYSTNPEWMYDIFLSLSLLLLILELKVSKERIYVGKLLIL